MLDPRSEVYTPASFEEAVEITASICLAAERAGRVSSLVLPSQPERAKDTRLATIDRLALVRMSTGVSIPDTFSEVRRAIGGSSALIMVTGDCDAELLIQQGRKVQRSGLVIVVRVVEGATPAFSSIGGGRIVTVPSAEVAPGIWAEAVTRR